MTEKEVKAEIHRRLPVVIDWVKSVAVQTPSKGSEKFLNVIIAGQNSKDSSDLTFDAPTLEKNIVKQIVDACSAQGWRAEGGFHRVTVKDTVYLCLARLNLTVGPAQTGRYYGLEITKALKGFEIKGLSIHCPKSTTLYDIFEGLAGGYYQVGIFKETLPKRETQLSSLPKKLEFIGAECNETLLASTKALARATAITRLAQDAPPNWLDPQMFADLALELGKEAGIKVSVLGKKDLEKLGMGSFLSVALGSPKEPKLIRMEIKGKSSKQKLALVGKGLTFDTGGTSLKPPPGMGEMKYDMSGGAAVLGAALYLAEVQPAMDVICLIGAVENIGGWHATRPSDIVVASNKKSIDIQNTDAEGRLVLADLLHYAVDHYKASAIVDLATLTGAVLMAFGHVGAGVMTNNQGLANQLLETSVRTGEPAWQLPLWPEFQGEIKSDIADLCNIAKPSVKAGSIIGGVFLSEFVGETPWVHLDIAGTAWQCAATGYPGPGGSGYGVKMLGELCSKMLKL